MLRLGGKLMDDPPPNVARLAAELPQWITGAWNFMIRSSRYAASGISLDDLAGNA